MATTSGTAFWGIDEKPLHFNEAGSKCIGTLEIAGAPVVRLKDNHSASRERVSLMTSVTSCPESASGALLPLELLCKAKSNRRTRGLGRPEDLRLSVQYADKGSYRKEKFIAYLERWLDPWTELRAERRDWRILFCGVAASHLGEDVMSLCHSRGYCLLYHYGSTTAVAQVNDTDLHPLWTVSVDVLPRHARPK